MKKHLKTWLIGLIVCVLFGAIMYVITTFKLVQMVLAAVFALIFLVTVPLIAGHVVRYFMGKE